MWGEVSLMKNKVLQRRNDDTFRCRVGQIKSGSEPWAILHEAIINWKQIQSDTSWSLNKQNIHLTVKVLENNTPKSEPAIWKNKGHSQEFRVCMSHNISKYGSRTMGVLFSLPQQSVHLLYYAQVTLPTLFFFFLSTIWHQPMSRQDATRPLHVMSLLKPGNK